MKFCEVSPGNPASATVGMSGALASRFALVDREDAQLAGFVHLERAWAVTLCTSIGMCPLMRSVIAGPAPR